MNEVRVNTTSSSLLSVFIATTMLGNMSSENVATNKTTLNYDYSVGAVFQNLPVQNIPLEQNPREILLGFLSKITNESKDLDGEIVDMVNRKFEKLLLKI